MTIFALPFMKSAFIKIRIEEQKKKQFARACKKLKTDMTAELSDKIELVIAKANFLK